MRRLSPAALFLASFAGTIVVGALLLATPAASASSRSLSPIDALFTSASAVCVTGLTVVDTATRLSSFGQAVVLTLIQFGGLGILTFSTFFALLAGRKISFAQREIVVGGVAPLRRVDVSFVLGRILATTFLIEAVGAGLLWLLWRRDLPPGRAAWHAAFHAVSAFCNAGFSTFTDNLVGFRGHWGVNLVVMALIVLGGIGFVVFIDVENRLRVGRRLGLHSRVVLATTGILILAGAGLILIFERGNTLRDAGWGEAAAASLFASITARTAGFNTIDYGQVTASTLVATMILMFVGGSPGSCAGGVKTTSAAALFAMARGAVRGRERPDLFRRSLPAPAIRQAQTVVLLAAALLVATIFFLHVTEEGPVPFVKTGDASLRLGFDAISAFGTVGLSTGITPSLSGWGKLTLIALMYVGRVGPLTVGLLLAKRRAARYHFAEEGVLIG